MKENKIEITEQNGQLQINSNGLSDFSVIGILECIIFEMKSTNRTKSSIIEAEPIKAPATAVEDPKAEAQTEAAPESSSPDIRTRISNAVKAIKGLGGETSESDLSQLSDKELQIELEELTKQYKRLKSAQSAGKKG